MKTMVKSIISLVLFVMPVMAFASEVKPSDVDDTIPAEVRYKDYYYTKWFDECPNFYPNGGVVDSTFCRFFEVHNFYGDPVAKWEHTNQPMKVKGLVAILDRYSSPYAADSLGIKLPEYLYLYQLVGRHYACLERYGIKDGLDLVLLDSVRWDTATARVMEYKRGWNGEFTQYVYLYEAYFKQPIYVDSDFYIFGSSNSNYPGSGQDGMIHTIYTDFMDFFWGAVKVDKDSVELHDWYSGSECHPQGGYVAIFDNNPWTQMGWYMPWPDSPWGYYLPIVDQWNLNAVPNDTAFGEVLGGGRWPDDTYDTIEAVPTPGFHFDSWSDGSTENPRVIHLTSDTSFVAYFYANESYTLSVTSSDETKGTVTGGGSYYGETDNTIAAEPTYTCKFIGWNDGVTENPRVIHLVSDTAFVAYFVDKEYYDVVTGSNNEEWGTVSGGGVYMEGEEATLTVTTAPFCIFEGWTDGEWQLPRVVTVTQDTMFTATFSFDSAWAAGIGQAGDLDFGVSPNPTTGRLTIRMGQPGEYEMRIYDMNGKAVVSRKYGEAVTEVDMSALPAGQYLLAVRSKERQGIRTIIKK